MMLVHISSTISGENIDTFSAVGVICGVDEAGRGPLAGPVYAACVVLNAAHKIAGLADSKELSEKKREVLAIAIKNMRKHGQLLPPRCKKLIS